MSDNGRLWLIAMSAALVGALLGAGAVWATQQSATAALERAAHPGRRGHAGRAAEVG